jgi:hypothetical protein
VRDYAPIEDDETDKKFNCGAIPICFRARLPHLCSIIAEKKPTKEERRERKLARDIPASSLKIFMTFVAEKLLVLLAYLKKDR